MVRRYLADVGGRPVGARRRSTDIQPPRSILNQLEVPVQVNDAMRATAMPSSPEDVVVSLSSAAAAATTNTQSSGTIVGTDVRGRQVVTVTAKVVSKADAGMPSSEEAQGLRITGGREHPVGTFPLRSHPKPAIRTHDAVN